MFLNGKWNETNMFWAPLTLSCGGSGWTIIATMWLLSTMNNEMMGLFESGGIRKHFREDHAWPRFQFSYPPKTMIIFLSSTPSKLLSDLKAPHQSSGYDFHFKIYGDPFEALHIKCSTGLLLWLHKEIIIILLICLRYDERRKAEDWIRWCRSCCFPGTNPHTVIWSCQTSLVHCNVSCLPWHLFFSKKKKKRRYFTPVVVQWNQQEDGEVLPNQTKPLLSS